MQLSVFNEHKIMKKIFLLFTAVAMSAGVVFAQDINQAIENVNNGNMEFEMGNKEAALTCFQTALTIAEGLGEEGADITATCKNTIPTIMLSMAKDLIKADNFDGGLEQLSEVVKTAELYGNADILAEANELIPGVYLSKGQSLLKAKNVAGAAEAIQMALAIDPTNAPGNLLYGKVLSAQGKIAEAEAAYLVAAENGQEKAAKKELSKIYIKLSQASLKAKKFQEAVDNALKANSFLEDANAYNLAAKGYQQLGKNVECIENFEKYLELKPNAKDASGVKFTIGALYQQGGNNAKAKEYYQMVVNDPNYGKQAQDLIKNL